MFLIWRIFAVVCYSMCVGTVESRKFDLLRQRISTLETRLSEDLAFIRKEFYEEIKALSVIPAIGENIENPGKEISIEGSTFEKELDELKSRLEDKFKTLQQGLVSEKRMRRELQNKVKDVKDKEMDIVKTIETMIQNSTANMKNIVKSLGIGKELFEVISVLEEIKEILQRLQMSHDKQDFTQFASSCMEQSMNGHDTSGIYTVFPKTIWRPLQVFCDMKTDGGGWTVFQRRVDGSENFL